MTKFEFNLEEGQSYGSRIRVGIAFNVHPTSADYLKIINAVKVLEEVSAIYINQNKEEEE